MATRIEPDVQFVQELQAVGGDTLKKCYQCATCSVVCPLSPADNPYPRKEMIWAQWGLKDKLVNDIDIWLCHNCGTCSDYCPRGAKPGDLLAALRNMAYKNLVPPKALGNWMSSAKYFPILFAIPAVLFLFVWYLVNGLAIPEGEIVYGKIFPGDYTIDPIFTLVSIFVAISFIIGVSNMIRSLQYQKWTYYIGDHQKPSWWQCIKDVIVDQIFTHRKWKQCGYEDESDKQKFYGHLILFWSFVALLVVTSTIAFGHWVGKVVPFVQWMGHTPLHLANPIKLLANIGAIGMVVGLALLTVRRLAQDPEKSTSSWYDWYLLLVIWAVGITGILAQLLRLFDVAAIAYPIYYIHLIFVFMLIAYLPWSKLGHLVYRTAALIYARRQGRVPMEEPVGVEEQTAQ
jgi:quinone-modifying oxidoreductase subunit QmoC